MKNITRTAAVVAACALCAIAWAAKPAMLRLKQENIALELTFDNKQKIVVTSKPVPLAPGAYTTKAARLIKQDDKKRAWEMRVEGDLSTLGTITVDAEQNKVIDAGEPISYDVFVWVTGKSSGREKDALLRVTAYGKYSEIYYPGALLGGRKPPTPAWKVVAENGKTMAQGQFGTPTQGGCVEVIFKVPKEFTGNVKIELTPIMGPFEWKYRNQEHNLP